MFKQITRVLKTLRNTTTVILSATTRYDLLEFDPTVVSPIRLHSFPTEAKVYKGGQSLNNSCEDMITILQYFLNRFFLVISGVGIVEEFYTFVKENSYFRIIITNINNSKTGNSRIWMKSPGRLKSVHTAAKAQNCLTIHQPRQLCLLH